MSLHHTSPCNTSVYMPLISPLTSYAEKVLLTAALSSWAILGRLSLTQNLRRTSSCSSGLPLTLLEINYSTSSPPPGTVYLVYTRQLRPLLVISGSLFLPDLFMASMYHVLGVSTNCIDYSSPRNISWTVSNGPRNPCKWFITTVASLSLLFPSGVCSHSALRIVFNLLISYWLFVLLYACLLQWRCHGKQRANK